MRKCSAWLPVIFRFLAHSLTTFGRWGCGEGVTSRVLLSVISLLFFQE
ncbi:replication protein [Escherichia coli]|nr:replication protein [Escherichia coli]